jgi:uncharacterized protein with PQ loop repeat
MLMRSCAFLIRAILAFISPETSYRNLHKPIFTFDWAHELLLRHVIQ